ncbi:MAG: UTP--glucose-1-phosphate uridylyltransferase [Planctomycetota bacterium]
MKSLTSEQLAFLAQYGFDAALFERWREAVGDGSLCEAANKIAEPILAPDASSIHDLAKHDSAEAAELEELGRQAIARGELGVVILNGGMATRFGGVVKGVVEVLGSRSFLELKIQDITRLQRSCEGSIKLFLMNSFATDEATREHFTAHENFGLLAEQVRHFTQFISVRMQPDGDLFATDDGGISSYGPGHGDFAPALRTHGCLQRFLDGGGKHLFVANVDNLGARVSPLLLGHHIRSGAEATVELAPKWPGDVGGAPYLVGGRLQLVEQLRFPEGFDPDIVDVFNTNTFHFRAESLDRDFNLGWYFVQKKVEGREAVQIERLIGELTRFLSTNYVRVKRTGVESRFLPVKAPDDLESGRDEIAEMYR